MEKLPFTFVCYKSVLDRFYWRALDPYNICEGMFAIANVLSFFRLFNLLAMSDQLGPLQVSLERMISVRGTGYYMFL